jgi:hypothetical protein
LPTSDLHCSLLSVPGAFGTTLATIPGGVPYLAARPATVAAWRRRLTDQQGLSSSPLPPRVFRVGVAWQGNPGVPADKGRSIPLKAFAPLCRIPGVRLISLQKGSGTEQLANLPPGMGVETLGVDFDSGPDAFLDTAAVMMHLDLIVTCDTAVAHLAGALGRPVWIVLKHVPDWRWMMDREDSPWYPTACLFRQTRAGDWDEVFTRVEAELARLAANTGGDQARRDLDPVKMKGTLSAPLSVGEFIDRLTILMIKSERMRAPEKLVNVRRELEVLTKARLRSIGSTPEMRELERELKRINEDLWEIEDNIRDCERRADFGPAFIDLARAVYKTNDRRAAVKRRINEVTGSALIEEKSYHSQLEARTQDHDALWSDARAARGAIGTRW